MLKTPTLSMETAETEIALARKIHNSLTTKILPLLHSSLVKKVRLSKILVHPIKTSHDRKFSAEHRVLCAAAQSINSAV